MKKVFLGSVAAATLGISSVVAQANVYVTGHLGFAKQDYEHIKDEYTKGLGVGIAGGFEFNEFLAAELGYNYLRGREATGTDGKAHLYSHTIDLLAKGTIPVSDVFSVYAKGGIARATSGISSKINNKTVSGSESAFVPKAALGADYHIDANVAIGAQVSRTFGTGSPFEEGYIPDLDQVGLALTYRFY